MEKYDVLKLENQVCFPLYACSKEVIRAYKPFLEDLNLTYTQYITMIVLWSEKRIRVKDLGEKLFLESNTLTPLLKRLEAKRYITRERSKDDKRDLIVCITEKGEELKERAIEVPSKVRNCIKFEDKKLNLLHCLLQDLLNELI